MNKYNCSFKESTTLWENMHRTRDRITKTSKSVVVVVIKLKCPNEVGGESPLTSAVEP